MGRIISDYLTGSSSETPDMVNADNIAPWVSVSFGTQSGSSILTPIITVGNKSAPPFSHHAAIKSFEYGMLDGHRCKVEIIDEEGGEFHLFCDKLMKNMGNASNEYRMQVQWGWTYNFCDGGESSSNSPIVTFVPINMEINFGDGVIKYNITGCDCMQVVFVGREDLALGSEDHPMALQDSIKELFDKREPKCKVKFLTRTDSPLNPTEWTTWSNKQDPKVKDTWTSDNQNKMGAVRRWVQPFTTKKNRGVVMAWDNTESEPTVVVWEDPTSEDGLPSLGQMMGSFIVNGGKASNVIGFTHNINWPAAFAMFNKGGGSGGPVTTEGQPTTNNKQTKQTGITSSAQITRQALNQFNSEAIKELIEADERHAKACGFTEGIPPIEGELRIQGNPGPKYTDSRYIMGSFVSIVVINPFTINGNSNGGCGDWTILADSVCNDILSNKHWRVAGVTHQIKEGSYVTTLKVRLDAPGMDLMSGTPVGGDGPWNPPNS